MTKIILPEIEFYILPFTDFKVGSLISEEEAFKLKAEAMSEVGLDMDVVLAKLRKLCL